MADYRKALLDPAAQFSSPRSLVASTDFTREQKIELLRRWYHDALELQTAEAEGMAGGERDDLRETSKALERLGAGVDSTPAPRES